ncbi:Homoserine O-acetyltransferase [Fagus crenata]
MAASATASGGAPNLRYSLSHPITKKAKGTIKFFIHNPLHFSRTTRLKTSFPIRALDPQTEEEEETENQNFNNKSGSFTSQEDLKYLWKLIAGSVVGAAVIKYGSVVFPEITRPNIVQALIMISTPVIVAVFLLIKQSRAET